MSKKPIAIISTDWHLKETNASELLDVARQEVALAERLKVRDVVWLGDMFDSRVSQRQDMLNCLDAVIDIHTNRGLNVHCIPGNHDKTDYTADESFLTPYRYHPNFHLYEKETGVLIKGVAAYFVPFYATETWTRHFNSIQGLGHGNGSILFSHTAIEGSINNDGSAVQSSIKASMFKNFDRVFLGHYHNAQQPARNVFHLPSVIQNNFGEDEDKGFTVLYDDLSFELLRSDFTPYREIVIDTLTASREDIKAVAEESTEGVHLRVTLKGDQQSIKGVNKKMFTDKGISVKTKYNDVEVDGTVTEEAVCRELSDGDIADKFKSFCEDKGYDVEEGLLILNQIMRWE